MEAARRRARHGRRRWFDGAAAAHRPRSAGRRGDSRLTGDSWAQTASAVNDGPGLRRPVAANSEALHRSGDAVLSVECRPLSSGGATPIPQARHCRPTGGAVPAAAG